MLLTISQLLLAMDFVIGEGRAGQAIIVSGEIQKGDVTSNRMV